ncbi:MAG TPA: RelA/SpoT domain-containing protein [Rhizomicrobium sp.]|nr:RelA/SpoT domain-containing protein [Rhizomicrobium sp.]
MPDSPEINDSEKLQLKDLLRAGEKLRPDIDRSLYSSELFIPPLTFRSRVKSEKRALEKLALKRAGKPQYAVSDLRDLVGFRFITLLKDDIAPVVDNFFRLLKGEAVSNNGIFKIARFREFKHYISDPKFNPETKDLINAQHDELKTILANHYGENPPVKLEHDFRAQYSGVHVILEFQCSLEETTVQVPVEFQVRSVFDDAWGEIDHKLFYEIDRKGLYTSEQQRLVTAGYLKILRNMLDTAADYAALVSSILIAPIERAPDIKKNLDDVAYIKGICEPLMKHAAFQGVLSEFIALADKKNQLDDALGKRPPDPAKNSQAYSALAEEYHELAERFPPADGLKSPDDKRYRTILCLLSMEEALCRLLSGSETQMQLSISQYRDIAKRFPEYPTCRFRHAQACAQLLEKTSDPTKRDELVQEASAEYGAARKLLDDILHANAHQHVYDLLISPQQRSYLDGNIERLWGFARWRISDQRREGGAPATTRDFDDVHGAYRVAAGALERLAARAAAEENKEVETQYFNLLNSTTFFAVEAHELAAKLMLKDTGLPSLDEVKKLVDLLEQKVLKEDIGNIWKWHTILRGRKLVGPETGVFDAAKRICELFSVPADRGLTDYQREVRERAYREAWPIVQEALSPKGPPNEK